MPSSGERAPHTEAAFQRLSAGDTIPAVRAFLKAAYPLITEGARNLTIKRASKLMAEAAAAAPIAAAAAPIVPKALGAVPVAANAAGGVGPVMAAAAVPQMGALPRAVPQAAPKAAVAAVPLNASGQAHAPAAKAAPPMAKAVQPVVNAVPPAVKAGPPVAKAVPPVAKAVPPVAKAVPPVSKAVPPVAKAVPPEAKAVFLAVREQDRWGAQWAEELNQEQRQSLKRRREAAEEVARRVNARHSFWYRPQLLKHARIVSNFFDPICNSSLQGEDVSTAKCSWHSLCAELNVVFTKLTTVSACSVL